MRYSALLLGAAMLFALSAGASAAAPTSRPAEEKFLDDLVRKAVKAQAAAADAAATATPTAQPGELAKTPADQGGADPAKEGAAADDEDDLVKALLRKAGGDSGKPIMVEIIDDMGAARAQLREKFDPGDETQKIQKRIVEDLNQAIDQASKASSSPPSSGKGEKQQKGSRQKPTPQTASGQPQTNNGDKPAENSRATQGTLQTGPGNQPIKEGRKEWGGLPDRDRSEVVEGRTERMIPRWQELINRYYTALSLQAQERNKQP